MKKIEKMIFVGTGDAMAYEAFNSSIAFADHENDCFLIDTGGGNSIFHYLNKSNIYISNIKHLFLTHNHTDHILGALWLIRKFASMSNEYICNLYMPESVYHDLINLCNITISKGQLKKGLGHIKFNIINNLETVYIDELKVTFFDTLYEKTTQFGCKIETEKLSIGFCGDVPLLKENFSILEKVDILIHEALCDSESAEKHKVYKKGHSTAKDAGKIAREISAKELFLIHKSDDFINNNKLFQDAIKEYDGVIKVPKDGEIFKL